MKKIIKWSYQNHVLHLCPWVFPEVLWSFWGNFVPLPLGVVFTGQGIEVPKPQLEYSNDSILGGSIGHLENVQKKKVRRSKYSLWISKSPGIILGPLRVLCLFFVFAQKIQRYIFAVQDLYQHPIELPEKAASCVFRDCWHHLRVVVFG